MAEEPDSWYPIRGFRCTVGGLKSRTLRRVGLRRLRFRCTIGGLKFDVSCEVQAQKYRFRCTRDGLKWHDRVCIYRSCPIPDAPEMD